MALGKTRADDKTWAANSMARDVDEDHPLEDVLKTAIDDANGDDVSLRDILKLFGDRAFGPIFTLLGLIAITPPLSGIPGLPTLIGLMLVLFAVQILADVEHIWLPKFISDRAVSKDKLEKIQDRFGGWFRTIDRLVTDRLEWAATGPARTAAAFLVVLLSIMMIPLEVIPFAVTLPGLAIAAIGLALLSRDGAIMLAAYALSIAGAVVLVRVSPVGSWLGLA